MLQQVLLPEKTSSIQEKLRIGGQDKRPTTGNDGLMMEPFGTKLDEAEIQLLGDLLEKMLRFPATGQNGGCFSSLVLPRMETSIQHNFLAREQQRNIWSTELEQTVSVSATGLANSPPHGCVI